MSDTERKLHYAGPDVEAPGSGRHGTGPLLTVAVVLAIPSLLVVYQNANDEPYMSGVRKSDALIQVGLGSILFVGWLAWAAALVVLVARRRRTTALLAMLFLPSVAVFYLGHSVNGYLEDVIRSQAPAVAPPAPAPTNPAPNVGS